MASRKELLAVLLDVGPHMHQHLDQVGRCLFNAVLSKILFQPAHEVAVVYFGSSETRNAVHDEMAAEGEAFMYNNISVQHPLQVPSLPYLTTLSNVERGTGPSDFLDALVVTLDLVLKAVEARMMGAINKRVVMVSNFAHPINQMDEDFRDDMVKKMQEIGLKLDVLCLEEGGGSLHLKGNLAALDSLLMEVRGDVYTFRQGSEVASYFRARDYTATATYRGPLSIGSTVNIGVKVIKKSSKESVPSLKMYSDQAQAIGNPTHSVIRDTEYKLASNPDEPVPPEERVQAYRYGKQLVPLSKEDAEALNYEPDKGFQILGFVPESSIPRQHFMKDSSVVVPDVTRQENCCALSALVRAMHRKKKVAVARASLRARSSLFLAVLTPLLGTSRRPDTLVMNHIPFAEDLRLFSFTPLQGFPDEVKPNREQMAAAMQFVKALELGGAEEGERERLQPEKTINPTLQKFFSTLGRKALDPEAPVADAKELQEKTFMLNLDSFPAAAAEAADKLRVVFPIKVVEKRQQPEEAVAAAAAAAQTRFAAHTGAVFGADGGAQLPGGVGYATPVEDFNALVAAGKLQQALQEMPAVVERLVTTSVGDRYFDKALQCVQAARAAAAGGQLPGTFNAFLTDLCTKYEVHKELAGFWRLLADSKVTLVHSDESEASDISPEQAAEFLRLHSGAGADAAAEQQAAAAMEVEDEFGAFE